MPGLLIQPDVVDNTPFHVFERPVQTVAVIGAGPSGLPAARHLRDSGLRVRVFERQPYAGGTWTFEADLPLQPQYPSGPPSIGDFKPSLPPAHAANLPFAETREDQSRAERLEFAPPNPVYSSLTNNVPTPCMEFKDFPWPTGTEWHVNHRDISAYVQNYAKRFHLDELTSYRTRVESVQQIDPPPGVNQPTWRLTLRQVEGVDEEHAKSTWWTEDFDAVVVASGHYGAPFVPELDGVAAWAQLWPDKIIHSRAYRRAETYKNKTVMIVGTGTSGVDIARDLSPHVTKIYQVAKTEFAGPANYQNLRKFQRRLLPANGEHVPEIKRFLPPSGREGGIEHGVIELSDGRLLTGIDTIIFATGYQYSFPFLQDYHRDVGAPQTSRHQSPSRVLVTDGSGVHNLYRDVFYIPEPTLAFLGLSINTATFSFFEYQSLAIARVFTGRARLPGLQGRKDEYAKRLIEKGGGKYMHLMGAENELIYVKETVDWLNADAKLTGAPPIEGHSEAWLKVKEQMLPALIKKLGLDLADLQNSVTVKKGDEVPANDADKKGALSVATAA